MSNLIYSPFATRRHFGRLLDERAAAAANEATSWVPSIDIREDDSGFKVLADLPGVDPAAVDITLDKNVLTIRGSRETSSETDEGGFKRRERISGSFTRRFTLPETVNPEAIKARADNGVLEISIPKREEELPRSIAIEA